MGMRAAGDRPLAGSLFKDMKNSFKKLFKSGNSGRVDGGDDIDNARNDADAGADSAAENPAARVSGGSPQDAQYLAPAITVAVSERSRRQAPLSRTQSAEFDWMAVEAGLKDVKRQVYDALDKQETPMHSPTHPGAGFPFGSSHGQQPRRRSIDTHGKSPLGDVRRSSLPGAISGAPLDPTPDGSPTWGGHSAHASKQGKLARQYSVGSNVSNAKAMFEQDFRGRGSDTRGEHSLSSSRSDTPRQQSNKEEFSLRERAGSVVDDYTIQEKLGDGGFSVVMSATEKKTGAKVALKLVRLRGCTDKQLKEVVSEAGLALGLNHPAIIKCMDVFVEKSTKECVFLMERMSGGSLQDHLMLHPNILSSADAAVVFASLMDAIKHCHSRGIVHCDIKPDNILIASSGDFSVTKLTDFGLALRTNRNDVAILNRVRGTEGFIAPELVAVKVPVEDSTDYSYTPRAAGRGLASLLGGDREGDLTPKRSTSLGGAGALAPRTVYQVTYTPAVDVWSAGVTLYSTLGGNWSKCHKQVEEWARDNSIDQRDCKFMFHNDSMWRRVWMTTRKETNGDSVATVLKPQEHAYAVHLVRWMLHPDPEMRATVRECIDHPWTKRTYTQDT